MTSVEARGTQIHTHIKASDCGRDWCTLSGTADHDTHHASEVVDFTTTGSGETAAGWWGWLVERAGSNGLVDLVIEGRPDDTSSVIRAEVPVWQLGVLREVLSHEQGRPLVELLKRLEG